MNNEPPGHLADKYRLYAIYLENDYGNRPANGLMIVHVGRPVSLESFMELFIFQNLELTVVSTNEKIKTEKITGIQKIDNQNIPKYEIMMGGLLKDIK